HQLLFNAPSARLKAGNRKTYGCNIAPARTCRREKAFAARDRGSGGRDQCLRFVAAGVVILFSLSPLFAGRGKASRAYASLALGTFEFERDVELGAVGFDLAFGVQLQIELHDFGDA